MPAYTALQMRDRIKSIKVMTRPCLSRDAIVAMIYLLSLSLGVVAGLRAMTAPAAVSWVAYLGWLKLGTCRTCKKFGNDRPAALLEDVVAIAGALLVVRAFL